MNDGPEIDRPEDTPENMSIVLATELGFNEPIELRQLRREAVEVVRLGDPEVIIAILDHYLAEGIELVENASAHAKMGLQLAKASILLEAKDITGYLADLDDTIWFAENMRDDDLVTRLLLLKQRIVEGK